MLLENFPACSLPEITNPLTATSLTNINYNRSCWVKLHNLPNPYSFDEALLLCPESLAGHWRVWIPDHGEAVLHQDNFYC